MIIAIISMLLLGCSKSNDKTDDMKRGMTVSVVDYNPPNLTNHYWAIKLKLDKTAIMNGNIIIQHDLWDLGQFKKTYIDTFDFNFNNELTFQWNTKRNSLYQGPEIKNIKVNKFTQTNGSYAVTIK